jgi:hypothetical protein
LWHGAVSRLLACATRRFQEGEGASELRAQKFDDDLDVGNIERAPLGPLLKTAEPGKEVENVRGLRVNRPREFGYLNAPEARLDSLGDQHRQPLAAVLFCREPRPFRCWVQAEAPNRASERGVG